jgi:hypothetical protein
VYLVVYCSWRLESCANICCRNCCYHFRYCPLRICITVIGTNSETTRFLSSKDHFLCARKLINFNCSLISKNLRHRLQNYCYCNIAN